MLLTNVILINLIIKKENMGENLYDLVLGKNFLGIIP